jgi:ankyrin repeat protein
LATRFLKTKTILQDTPICRAALAAADRQQPGLAREIVASREKNGATALHWAATNLNIPGMELCAKYGADPNAQDDKGRTPLHWAARKYGAKAQARLFPVLAWLRVNGADFHLGDHKGKTPLMELAAKGPIDIIESALGFDVQTLASDKDSQGQTVIDVLLSRGGHARAFGEALLMAMELKKELSALGADGGADGASSTDSVGSGGSTAGGGGRNGRRL